MRPIALNILPHNATVWPNLPIELGCRYQANALIGSAYVFRTWT
jgi:hypothetical protein